MLLTKGEQIESVLPKAEATKGETVSKTRISQKTLRVLIMSTKRNCSLVCAGSDFETERSELIYIGYLCENLIKVTNRLTN